MSKRIYSDWSGNCGFSLKIKTEDAHNCSHPGPCDSDIDWLLDQDYIKKQFEKIDPEKIKNELEEYSDWDCSDPLVNQQRILWIACGDIHYKD